MKIFFLASMVFILFSPSIVMSAEQLKEEKKMEVAEITAAGGNRDAIERLDRMIVSDPENPDAYYFRALSYLNSDGERDYKKILEDIDSSIKYYPSEKHKNAYITNAAKYAMRATADKWMGELGQALLDMELAVNLNPESAIGLSGAGPGEAPPAALGKKDFDEIVDKFPNDFRGYLFRGLYYSSLNSHAFAVNDYKKAISLKPESALGNYLLGKAYYKKAQSSPGPDAAAEGYKNAALSFTRAIQSDPGMLDAYRLRAAAYVRSGEHKRAVMDYDTVIRSDPGSGEAYFDRGLANKISGDLNMAIDDMTKAIAAKKQMSSPRSAYMERADAYAKLGDHWRAVEDLTRAIDLHEGMPAASGYDRYADTVGADLRVRRGDAYFALKDLKKAMTDYNDAVESDPGYANKIERWKLFFADTGGKGFIDIRNIAYPMAYDDGTVRVWVKYVYNRTQKRNVKESVLHVEVQCQEKVLKSALSSRYDPKGAAVKSRDAEADHAVLNTLGQSLYTGWCRQYD